MAADLIPVADVIACAVLGVCYLIALIVILVQAEGTSRALAVTGVLALFASTVLGALNGSVQAWLTAMYGANAYGLASIVIAVVGAAGLVLLVSAMLVVYRRHRRFRSSS
ncbi:hypothetical protein GCM10011575_26000 [Microlunatus endophyticus]|uniref:Uncharacterized protein n=1 Tax=Microlunatus endophyticus TaxID=1716077 RepID=A0A917S9Z6_9ACTN|nr:hypothetical protein [Microlunatus endophyticus]GGL66278.1 hypothetical protein GCM10011575_26000 [Microlunatus endophyticus]